MNPAHPTPSLVSALVMLLAGCGSQIGTENSFGCQVDDTVEVSDLSAVPEGFSQAAADALASVTGTWTGTLLRGDGMEFHDPETAASQPITIRITPDGSAEIEERSVRDSEPKVGIEPDIAPAIGSEDDGLDCEDGFRLPATITVTSGADLDETLPGVVFVDASGDARWFVETDAAAMQGDARPTTFDPASMDTTTLSIDGRRDAGSDDWSGSVSFQGEKVEGTGPDGIASATIDRWGTWTTGEGVGEDTDAADTDGADTDG